MSAGAGLSVSVLADELRADYALDKSVRPNSAEIWDWTAGRIRTTPVSEVQVVEGEG